jgi:hypothetical protein
MKARVRVVCPICGVDLACYAKVVEANNASWVLSPRGTQHLNEEHK